MVSTSLSFFISGNCLDPSYANVRDGFLPEARQFVESLWPRFSDLADPHFRKDARNHFLERFWEMYLGVTLRERGFQLRRAGREGPEFYFIYNHRKVWVEAVVPGPGEGIDRVPELSYGRVQKRPDEKILLRFTNSLDTKRKKYKEALEKRIINSDDLYLLAINSRGIRNSPFGGIIPIFVKAFLPIGNPAMIIDNRTNKVIKRYHQYRNNVVKASGETISTTSFLNHEYSFISAVLHSDVDCANHPDILGDDFSILYNPNAAHHLDISAFSWCEQIFYRDGELERRPGKKM